MSKIKNIIITSLCGLFILIFPVWGLIAPDKEISESERRPLKLFPSINSESIFSGTFMSDFEGYTLDHFPLRDDFRRLKSLVAFYGFNQKDNNDIFIYNNHAIKLEYPYNEESLIYASDRFGYVYDTYLSGCDAKVYLSIIPDKSYFVPQSAGYLSIDFDQLTNSVKAQTPYAQYIDIFPLLSLDDYYFTDTHWKQENIIPVAQALCQGMGGEYIGLEYETHTSGDPFFGVYYGQSALPLAPDSINYLESDTLKNTQVYDFETDSFVPVYNTDLLQSKDPYEMFLSGPKSLLVMENKDADTDKELIIFRDSFTSALAPLMMESYSKITLVDIRYISPNILGNFIDFTNQDVLFLYSTSVLNNSITIK